MEFCDKCGKPLVIKENLARCSCGFTTQAKPILAKEKIKEQIKKGEGVAEKDDFDQGFPHVCKKCGHEFAEVVDLGIFYGDEASVYLFKCKKCENTERDADGSSNA